MARSSSVRVDVAGDQELQRLLREAGRDADRAIRKALVSKGLDIQNEAKQNVPRNFGRLGSVIRWRISRDGLHLRVGVFEDAQAGGHQINYAPYVEFPTRKQAGRPMGDPPPIDPIKLWVKRVLQTTDPSAIWGVWHKVWTEGTEGQPFLEPAYEDEKDDTVDEVRERLREAIQS